MTKLIVTAVVALAVASAAAAHTQPPQFYWTKPQITAVFALTVKTEQVGKTIPATAKYTFGCQGLARADGIHGAPDYLITRTGKRFRFWLCAARSSCFVGGVWRVRYSTLTGAGRYPTANITRVSASPEDTAHPNPSGC